MKPFLKDYPNILELMSRRPDIYNQKLDKLEEYIKSEKVILISPDDDKGLSMITRNKDRLTAYYNKGYNDAEKIFNVK